MRRVDVRIQTVGEEVANTISHAAGLIVIIAVALITWPLTRSGSNRISTPAAIVYLSTMVLMYATSALYHGLPPGVTSRPKLGLSSRAIWREIARGVAH